MLTLIYYKDMAKTPNKSLSEVVEVPIHIRKRVGDYLSVLNAKQKKFCIFYTSDELFANGVKSYAKAYGLTLGKPGVYDTCKTNASRLLTNANILKAVDVLLEIGGLNDAHVDKQLNFLITQSSDLKSKLGGIKEYNQLKGRVTQKLETKGIFLMGNLIRGHREAQVVEEKPKVVRESIPQVVEKKPTRVQNGSSLIDNILESHGI